MPKRSRRVLKSSVSKQGTYTSKQMYSGGRQIASVSGPSFSLVSPTQFGGLQLWLAADSISGLADDAAVATWSDLSGNGRDFTQGTAANRPLYKTNIVGGKPVVRFDGSNDFLAGTLVMAQPFTILVVAAHRSGDVATNEGIVSGVNFRPFLGTISGTPDKFGIYSGLTLVGADLDTSFHHIVGVYNGATSSISVDGVTTAGDPGPDGSTGTMAVGAARADSPTEFSDSDIAEVIIYNRALPADELTKMGSYFSRKYGL
jgi:hypothetical protein